MSAMLPVIDIARIDRSPESLEETASRISEATARSGFFYLAGHGIPETVIADLRDRQRAFFDLPAGEKSGIAINQVNRGYLGPGAARMHGAEHTDIKEVFFWGQELAADDPDLLAGRAMCGPNRWPDRPDGFREAVLAYHEAVRRAGDRVLRAMAVSLGAREDFFRPYYERAMLRGQLIHYPAPPEDVPESQFGVAPHSDFGCITLLLQETPGLEVLMKDGEWAPAPPVEGTLVVNIGDLLERWSNLRLPSTKHRVRNTTGAGRYSIAMFYDPSPAAVVDPGDLLPDVERKFEPIEAADYIMSRNRGAFAHYKPQANIR